MHLQCKMHKEKAKNGCQLPFLQQAFAFAITFDRIQWSRWFLAVLFLWGGMAFLVSPHSHSHCRVPTSFCVFRNRRPSGTRRSSPNKPLLDDYGDLLTMYLVAAALCRMVPILPWNSIVSSTIKLIRFGRWQLASCRHRSQSFRLLCQLLVFKEVAIKDVLDAIGRSTFGQIVVKLPHVITSSQGQHQPTCAVRCQPFSVLWHSSVNIQSFHHPVVEETLPGCSWSKVIPTNC